MDLLRTGFLLSGLSNENFKFPLEDKCEVIPNRTARIDCGQFGTTSDKDDGHFGAISNHATQTNGSHIGPIPNQTTQKDGGNLSHLKDSDEESASLPLISFCRGSSIDSYSKKSQYVTVREE